MCSKAYRFVKGLGQYYLSSKSVRFVKGSSTVLFEQQGC